MVAAVVTERVTGAAYADLVRDLFVVILRLELANQQALATADGADPARYALQVFKDRYRPFTQWADITPNEYLAPIVNVTKAQVNIDPSASVVGVRQKNSMTLHIDVYGVGRARAEGGGQVSAEEEAASERDWGAHLVSQLMSSNTNPQLQQDPKCVSWGRFRNYEYFTDSVEEQPTPAVRAVRMMYEIEFTENRLENVANPLLSVFAELFQRDVLSGDEVLAAELEVLYPLPS